METRTDQRFISGLDPDVRSDLQRRADGPGIRHLVGYVGCIVLFGFWVALRLPGWWFAVPVLGVLLTFLFTLEHEATHKTPFANERLNEWVGWVCGVILLLPFTWFRYFHLAHHRFTNDPDRDPELLAGGKPNGWAGYVWHVTGIPYWVGMLRQLIALALGRAGADYIPKSARGGIIREARWMMGIYTVCALSLFVSPVLLWIWIIPMLIGQPFLRLYLLAEHGRCAFVADMFVNTRTTMTNRAVRWLAWNMPFHAEHHAMPNVPFHKLPDLHAMSQPYLKEVEPGYVSFHRKNAPKMDDFSR